MTVLLRHLGGDPKSGQRGTLCLRARTGAAAIRRPSCDLPRHVTMRLISLAALSLTSAAVLACARPTTPTTRPLLSPLFGPYDVIIEKGRVVDGTGAAWFYGDVGIRRDRIAVV